MKHTHQYDANGQQLCCTREQKIYKEAGATALLNSNQKTQSTAQHHDHDGHDHSLEGKSLTRLFIPSSISLLGLLLGLAWDYLWIVSWFTGNLRMVWYLLAYLPVGLPVLRDALLNIRKGDWFSEFFLMSIATIGAFAIGEYPEGVAVMLFYAVGEVFQTMAVSRAKSNIKSLLDQRPDEVRVLRDGKLELVKASTVQIDELIQLKPGEKLGLDGILISERASFNTSALTGESQPDTRYQNEEVLAGMINLNTIAQVKVTTAYEDSKLSRILDLVENANAQKAPTELFIRKFANIYTPIVVLLAIGITFFPYFFVADYVFKDWLYRALIFLVISCPCALVISIPLGYFGGIGAASKNGILFKGSNYLDALANLDYIVMDKTGTMTEGVFIVQEVVLSSEFDREEILSMVNVLESHSSHPVATAIHDYVGVPDQNLQLKDIEEIPGHGLRALINENELLVGNFKLMDKFKVKYDVEVSNIVYTTIAIAYGGVFVGYLTIADSIKEDALLTIQALHSLNVKSAMLSGDKSSVVQYVAKQLGIDIAYGDLLPEDKVTEFTKIKANAGLVAFVGDGVNDAPVVALSDVGIAMGGLGSDATIETANVVIQDDRPSKIPIAINIGKKTKRIVWQNISLAFGVKIIVLVLGAGGLATMWEAVFADVGVALLAILNAIRIQKMKFEI